MGRRSRKRSEGVPAPRAPSEGAPATGERAPATGERAPASRPTPTRAAPRPGSVRRRAKLDEAPKAPWHPFPLVELAILAGLVLLVAGYFSGGERREVLFVGGLALVCLASLELVAREHFAGYRSHSSLLALASAFLVGAPVYVATGSRPATVIAGLATAAFAFWPLRAIFARKAGGFTWRA